MYDWTFLFDEDDEIILVETEPFACVTLKEQKDGGYLFLSNWKCDRPVIPTAYPNWDPDLVLSLDGLEP